MEINHHLHNCRWHATPATLEGKGTWVDLGDYKLRFCFPDVQYPLSTELNLSVHSPGLICRKVSSALLLIAQKSLEESDVQIITGFQ